MTFSPSTWQQQSNTTWRNKPNSFCPENFSRCCAIHFFISEGQHVLWCIFACCVLCACIWFVNGWRKKKITTGRQVTMWQLHRLLSNSIASKVRRSGHKQGRSWRRERKETKRERSSLLLKDNKQITGESLRILPVYCCAMLCSLSGLCSLLRYGYTPMRCRSEPVWKDYKLGTLSAYFLLY